MTVRRVILLVIDGLGLGPMPGDPLARPQDRGADTLGNVLRAVGPLSLPNLERLGLGRVAPAVGLRVVRVTTAGVPSTAQGMGGNLFQVVP